MSKSMIITKDEYMMKKLEPITPGEVLLEEFLKPMGITQSQFAKDLKVPANRISQIIHGKREITADTALRLGKYFGIELEFWLNLQSHYAYYGHGQTGTSGSRGGSSCSGSSGGGRYEANKSPLLPILQ